VGAPVFGAPARPVGVTDLAGARPPQDQRPTPGKAFKVRSNSRFRGRSGHRQGDWNQRHANPATVPMPIFGRSGIAPWTAACWIARNRDSTC